MKKGFSKEYLDYIHSVEWRKKRQQAFRHYGYKCQRCGSRHALQVHHLTYARLGRERISDLAVLCKTCHDLIHDRRPWFIRIFSRFGLKGR